MKSIKKIFALLMSVIMVFSMFSTSILAATDGKITISNTNSTVSMNGHKYTAYKIFDVIYDASKTNYSYSITNEFKSFFNSKGYNTDQQAYDYVANLSGDEQLQILAKELYAAKGAAVGKSVTATSANQAIIDGLDHGYYLVYDEGNSGATSEGEKTVAAAILTTTNPEVTVNLKADAPTMDKKITGVSHSASNEVGSSNTEAVDAQIGEHIQFKLTSKVPDLTGYSSYTYTISDTLSKGLTFDNNVKVMIGANESTTQCTIIPNGQTFTVTIPYSILKANNKGDAIVVTYSATLNKDALVYPDGTNTNTASLKYSNNPNDGSSVENTPSKEVKVYTFQLDITKQNSSGGVLGGAEFTLKNSDGSYIALVKDGVSGKYIVDPSTTGTETNSLIVSDGSGKIFVVGLKAGNYTLTETRAPEGYNLLSEPMVVTIAATYNGEHTELVKVEGNTPVVVNNTGSLLPTTGGIGTTIFVVAGIGIMALAVVLMIMKKKKHGKES
ncbi:LPXTG-motif cell wall anchor domain-containing protein/fimbrial isopeptide formation D2 domain-containing protein [Hathewaya proteolytica DSM 3090]|uniref:LPXTG-motif cell wall anchor domain-containing protein/fimbrial isopeptide formation D2 domain-containing protein n=1 Tax=Hathewaya proteolytica DSM 3090 TaxID=1121331 RepID=A0A1M6MHR1_9CLOT|nr:SpaH/EbpB family LPXTG-anchored major pilin [Hathewaya proteolytica]SHJ83012.1 LPXTG-motif cell wall anchor domain-containing protein/fimbrial isopeptide formation D2 domain-containing protein [Hathewaya proteolytica DSM 3090]